MRFCPRLRTRQTTGAAGAGGAMADGFGWVLGRADATCSPRRNRALLDSVRRMARPRYASVCIARVRNADSFLPVIGAGVGDNIRALVGKRLAILCDEKEVRRSLVLA